VITKTKTKTKTKREKKGGKKGGMNNLIADPSKIHSILLFA